MIFEFFIKKNKNKLFNMIFSFSLKSIAEWYLKFQNKLETWIKYLQISCKKFWKQIQDVYKVLWQFWIKITKWISGLRKIIKYQRKLYNEDSKTQGIKDVFPKFFESWENNYKWIFEETKGRSKINIIPTILDNLLKSQVNENFKTLGVIDYLTYFMNCKEKIEDEIKQIRLENFINDLWKKEELQLAIRKKSSKNSLDELKKKYLPKYQGNDSKTQIEEDTEYSFDEKQNRVMLLKRINYEATQKIDGLKNAQLQLDVVNFFHFFIKN